MERDLVKRFIKKDGSQRISFYREEYAENPRDTTDEPLHCEDWNRDYSIMITKERADCFKSSNARSCLNWLIREYGGHKKILDTLIKGGRNLDKTDLCDALVYDKHEKKWILYSHGFHYDFEQKKNVTGWFEYDTFYCRKDELDTYEIIDMLGDDSIDYIVKNCMTDGVKMASYDFGYQGHTVFYDEVSCDSEGIAWLEKDEFLKYSGCSEENWKDKSLKDTEWLLDEIEAWSENEVYGFVVEDAVRIQGIKTYYNGEREDEPYIDTQWEESDSCWGFYGELDKRENDMFEQSGLNKEEFEEENV